MKIAPILGKMREYPDEFQNILVHTGQHYDRNMSQVFFEDLGLPEPDVFLSTWTDVFPHFLLTTLSSAKG